MFKSFSIKFFIAYTFITLIMFIMIYYGFNYFLVDQFSLQTVTYPIQLANAEQYTVTVQFVPTTIG